jgi:large subunit ribosomal protein L23
VKNPHEVIVQPYITERSVTLSQGDPTIHEDTEITRKYTFLVNTTANKIEIKQAVEAIYNAGKKKKEEQIVVDKVHTVRIPGKKRRVGRNVGYRPDKKKAIVTLAKGQILEDYGV